MVRSPGRAPDGYRQFISPRRRYATPLLHLSTDGKRTLCRLYVRDDWQEPAFTQRTKCRECWAIRAEAMRTPEPIGFPGSEPTDTQKDEHERHAALGENHWQTCPLCDDAEPDDEGPKRHWPVDHEEGAG